MKEEWRDIKGYEGLYMVSNMGKVKSLNYNHTGKEKILKAGKDKDGYLYINLYKEGKKHKCLVHRLVAIAFIENLQNLPVINHKDEDKKNNCVQNLEWCSVSYNNTYNDKAKKIGKKVAGKLRKPVFSVNKETGLIMYWESITEAEKCTGIDKGSITRCCQGKVKSAGNHLWYYAGSNDDTTE